jgi:hypothetical protein
VFKPDYSRLWYRAELRGFVGSLCCAVLVARSMRGSSSGTLGARLLVGGVERKVTYQMSERVLM